MNTDFESAKQGTALEDGTDIAFHLASETALQYDEIDTARRQAMAAVAAAEIHPTPEIAHEDTPLEILHRLGKNIVALRQDAYVNGIYRPKR